MKTHEVITPVFALVALGYMAARAGLCSKATLAGLSQFVFNVAVPALLFRSMAMRGAQSTSGLPLLVAYYGPALLLFALGYSIVRLRGTPPKTQVVAAMAASYGNCALLGVPLVLEAYGEPAVAPFFLLLAIHGPLLMTVTAIAFESLEGAESRSTPAATVRRTVKGLVSNPIVVALVSGSLYASLSTPLPKPIDDTLALLGRAAVPCALFALGGTLTQYRMLSRLDLSLATSALKLGVLPALVWLACGQLDLSPIEIRVATLTAAMPTGVNVFLFADRYRADLGVASSSVLLSTALAVPVLPLWLDALGSQR